MNEIIVGFSRPKAWLEPFSWLIRLVTWSPISHAYIRFFDEEHNRWIVFQASGLKVNFIGQIMFDNAEDIYAEFSVPVSDSMKSSVVQGAIDKCGSSYGIGQIFGFAWVLMMRMLGKSVSNPFYSASSFVCSELVGDVLIEIGEGNLDPSAMTPKDMLNFMLSKMKPIGA